MSLVDALKVGPSNGKILVLDIETSPSIVYAFGRWQQNIGINQVVQDGAVICFAAKWYGKPKTIFRSDHHHGHDVMVQAAHDLLDEAEIVVGYNHKSFDIRHLHREFILAGMSPPSPHKDVDLLTVVKQASVFESNKLDNIAQRLDIGAKVKHEGFELWKLCMAGDNKAWARMKAYNLGDILLTEKLYDRLRGWIPNHPHALNGTSDDRLTCNQCWSDNLEDKGIKLAQQITYRLYKCRDCGANVQGTRHSRAAITRGAR